MAITITSASQLWSIVGPFDDTNSTYMLQLDHLDVVDVGHMDDMKLHGKPILMSYLFDMLSNKRKRSKCVQVFY